MAEVCNACTTCTLHINRSRNVKSILSIVISLFLINKDPLPPFYAPPLTSTLLPPPPPLKKVPKITRLTLGHKHMHIGPPKIPSIFSVWQILFRNSDYLSPYY